MQLPDELRAALEAELEKVRAKEVAMAVRDLSQRYRADRDHGGFPLLKSSAEVAAYAVYRLPATFAAIGAVLREVRARRPDLEPKTLLDVGAGPGTSAWAAVEVWPELERIVLLERDARMIELGKALAGSSSSAALRGAVWHRADVTRPWECGPADVTIAAYLLGELPPQTRAEWVRGMWEHTADTCAVVEPGTPHGFERIRLAGDEAARAGAHILAPFPQDWQCLESEKDWCHFSQRVPRTRLHRIAKEASLSYEDEKYSYVSASRLEGLPIAARVIRQPQVRSGHVRLVLCTAEGIKHMVVTRSQGKPYRLARDLGWGAAIPVEDAPLFGLSVG